MSARRLDPRLPITGLFRAGPSGFTLGDFWSWAFSDLLDHDVRAAFAQFVVCLGLDRTALPRVSWTGGDLPYRGRSLRVVHLGHVAAWDVDAPATVWQGAEGERDPHWSRQRDAVVELGGEGAADCWIVSHDPRRDPRALDPLDVAEWEFFVLPHHAVELEAGPERVLALRRMRFLAEPVDHAGLRQRVDQVLRLEN